MELEITLLGALLALVVAIGLILIKVPPAYGMITGAMVGALLGGANLAQTTSLMISGAQSMMPATLRILMAGVLAGVLMESGAAKVIAASLIRAIGAKRSLLALALSTLLLTSVGVFIDVAVITVAPIALVIASQGKLSYISVLLAMVGGGKAGNIISPNPNTIAAADTFDIPLTSLMAAGIVPALVGLVVTLVLANHLKNKGPVPTEVAANTTDTTALPPLWAALVAPLVAIVLLSLRPIAGITIDPMVALPLGGLAGALAMARFKHIVAYASVGLGRMSGVAIMLIGTGTLAGVIARSALRTGIVDMIAYLHLPSALLAPISGAAMSLATASTTAGTTVAATVFGPTLLQLGVAPLAAAAMIHAGATVLDHMPHGSFFHATGGSLGMGVNQRLKVIPYETLVGLSLAATSTLIYGFILG